MKRQRTPYNEKAKESTQKYLSNLHQLRVWIKKDEWQAITQFAKEHGYDSSSAFVKKTLFDAMEKSKYEKIYIDASNFEKLKEFAYEHGYKNTSEFILRAINEAILRESQKK